MKKIILTLFILSLTNFGFSQDILPTFYREVGVKLLASLAHPTNIYESGTYEVHDDYILVNIYYEQGYYAKLTLNHVKGLVYKIEVRYNSDWSPAFSAIHLTKNLFIEGISEEDRKEMDAFEKFINKSIEDMTGEDIACFMITLAWLDYSN